MSTNQRSVEYLDELAKQIARVVMAASYYEDELTVSLAAAMVLNELQCNALVRPLSIYIISTSRITSGEELN